MPTESDSPLDQLWNEYGQVFREFDDLTLARWLAQTLGQLGGKAWRWSHPLDRRVPARRASRPRSPDLVQTPGDRRPPHIWNRPAAARPCFPFSRATSARPASFASIAATRLFRSTKFRKPSAATWKTGRLQYAPVHAVAHWDDRQRKGAGNYDRAYEQAAKEAEALLARAGQQLAPRMLEFYPAVVWEDQDECLEVRPEDVFV